MSESPERCGAQATFWPDVEACEAECALPLGHQPAEVHEDETLGEWHEDDLPTHNPARPAAEQPGPRSST